jgi:hypothetical protein
VSVLKAKDVEQALRDARGNMAAVGRQFGVSREAVRQFVAARPTLKAVCDECRESMKDTAESALYDAVARGEAWAVCFYLKTQAKDRGYIERPADEPKDAGKSPGVPVDVLTRLFALLGARQAEPLGPGGAAVRNAVDS